MTYFEVYWESSGQVHVKADTPEKAKQIVSRYFSLLSGPYPSHSMDAEFVEVHVENEYEEL